VFSALEVIFIMRCAI